jgi:acetylornithine deacetylase/succinyl-diaminopimelate desuccinylase-like protein
MKKLLFATLVMTCVTTRAQDVRAYRQAHEKEILASFVEFLSIPNVVGKTDAARANISRNAAFIVKALAARGIQARLLEVPDAPPVVYAEINPPGAKGTVTFYAHYDGQPVEPSKWTDPPFQPTMHGDRLYGRSTSDDKAPIQAMLTSLDAMKQAGVQPSANIRFFFEGEEEAGSVHLPQIVEKYRDLIKTDLWLFCDGPVDQSRRQQIYFGARGDTHVEMTVYGPIRELHSGHYGNWAPNPAMMMARLLTSMKDDDGKVLIKGFYGGIVPFTASEKQAMDAAPLNDSALMKELGLARVEGGGIKLIDLISQPSLTVRGFSSSSVGETARNVIPATAIASIDMRTVKGIDYKQQQERLVEHVKQQGYHVVDKDPDMDTRLTYPKIAKIVKGDGYNAARTSIDLTVSKRVISTLEKARGPLVVIPTLGGSIPLYLFTDTLNTPAIGIPIANHDNNQHSVNENIRLQNLWDGIETMTALLMMKMQ